MGAEQNNAFLFSQSVKNPGNFGQISMITVIILVDQRKAQNFNRRAAEIFHAFPGNPSHFLKRHFPAEGSLQIAIPDAFTYPAIVGYAADQGPAGKRRFQRKDLEKAGKKTQEKITRSVKHRLSPA